MGSGASPAAGRLCRVTSLRPDPLANSGLGVAPAVDAGHEPDLDSARCVLALVAGEDQTRSVPALCPHAEIDTVTGPSERYRDRPTIEVPDAGGYVDLDVDRHDRVLAAFPESSAPAADDSYTITEGGVRAVLEFVDGDDGLVVLWERHRYVRGCGVWVRPG